jgi:hypothetical protein
MKETRHSERPEAKQRGNQEKGESVPALGPGDEDARKLALSPAEPDQKMSYAL